MPHMPSFCGSGSPYGMWPSPEDRENNPTSSKTQQIAKKILGNTGHLEQYPCFQKYLKEGCPQCDFRAVLLEAIDKNCFAISRFLLSAGQKIATENIRDTVLLAAERGQFEILCMALKSSHSRIRSFFESLGIVSPTHVLGAETLVTAMSYVIDKKHAAVSKVLLNRLRKEKKKWDKDIHKRSAHLDYCVVKASAHGLVDVIKLLLHGNDSIDPGALGQAVTHAVEQGSCDLVKYLLSQGRTLSQECFNEAVHHAIQTGHLAILKCLLSATDKIMSQEDMDTAFSRAAAGGYLDLVRYLLNELNAVSQEGLEDAVRNAAREGRLDIVRYLLSADRTMSQQAIGYAVYSTAQSGHLDVARFLLSAGRTMSQTHLDLCLRMAASQGHLSLVEFFVRYGPIHEQTRDTAITQATGPHCERIRDILHTASTLQHQATMVRPPAQKDMVLKLSDVKERPEVYLATLFEQGFPAGISLVEENGQTSPATDLGGVTKQFTTSLCIALVQHDLLSLNDHALPVKKANESTHKHLGRLFSLVHEANLYRSDKILTGHIVNEHFLEMVQAIALYDDEEGFNKVCTLLGELDTKLQPVVCLALQPTLEHANTYLSLFCEDPLTEDKTPELQQYAQAARQQLQPFYLAAKDFLKGTTPKFRSQLVVTGNIQELARSVQGAPLTQLGILQALRLSEDRPLPPKSQEIICILASENPAAIHELQERLRQEPSTESLLFEDKIDWIVREIALQDPQVDRTWLDRFLFALTGKIALSPGMTLLLQQGMQEEESAPEELPFEIRTCFNRLTIPTMMTHRDDFMLSLKYALDFEDYNMA